LKIVAADCARIRIFRQSQQLTMIGNILRGTTLGMD
jgi:hypothetical protein